jgi:type I restriction enzyme M protein
LAEGKKGGQFYTPKSIVSLIVQMLEPFKGRVYDPAMGSGGFFVQSEHFIREHQGKIGEVSIYGQEYNHTTWQLAAMNMAIRGIDFNFGKEPANTYTNDQHPDLRADFVMANPPFNMKEWDVGVSDDDPRWNINGQTCRPPSGNANFAWLLHMLFHLAPNGSLGLLLANGSMSSNTNNEGEIRRKLIENDLVECMVALPGQLFTNTQIPACIWFLTKNKGERVSAAGKKLRNRKGEVLFIDARNLGYMKDRVLRDFTQDDLAKVTSTYHNWQTGNAYENVAGFCFSAELKDLEKHDFVLTPGRYVGAAEEEDDGEPFAEKMQRLTAQLKEQFEESARLEAEIKKNLMGLGYEC